MQYAILLRLGHYVTLLKTANGSRRLYYLVHGRFYKSEDSFEGMSATVKITAQNHILACDVKSQFYLSHINANNSNHDDCTRS